MANKQSDPVYILAETIIDSVQQIATSKTDKAAYDKTYSAVILGTNQKFVGDISEQDKTMVIEKFSIPEAVEEGEQTYYTFKINGAYYCKRQNGNFKLYDKVMVYIPNGDWSNMYFDYPDASSHGGNGGGGGSGNEHQLIVSVEAPGGADPKLGDMWLFVNSEDKAVFEELTKADFDSIYTWQEDENTSIRSWLPAKCTITNHDSVPPTDGRKGDLWIKKIEDGDTFEKLYLCTSGSGSGQTTWSEVYPNDETGEDYNLYISADRPLAEGDYWVEIDNETTQNILSLSVYKFNEDNTSYEWKLLYNAGTPAVYIRATDPTETYDVKKGDYWIKISNDSETLIYNVSKWNGRMWIRQCVAGGDLTINVSHAILVQKDEVQ